MLSGTFLELVEGVDGVVEGMRRRSCCVLRRGEVRESDEDEKEMEMKDQKQSGTRDSASRADSKKKVTVELSVLFCS